MGPNLPHPIDYILHALGGALIAQGLLVFTTLSFWWILAVILVLGYMKEFTDLNIDHLDAFAWPAGAALFMWMAQ